MRLFRDTWLVFTRSVWLTVHNPVWLFVGVFSPILYLVFFGPLLEDIPLGGAGGAPAGNAYNVFIPGLLVLNAMFGSAFVGFGLLAELHAGVVERMRVTPISRVAMMLGRVLSDVANFLFQCVVLVVLAIPFGLEVSLGGAILAFLVLVLIGLVIAPASYAIALAVKTEDAFAPLVNTITLPLMLLSGILLPMSLAPHWLQVVASVNPLYHAVESVRALFNGTFTGTQVWLGIGLMAALAVVTTVLSSRSFNRAVA